MVLFSFSNLVFFQLLFRENTSLFQPLSNAHSFIPFTIPMIFN